MSQNEKFVEFVTTLTDEAEVSSHFYVIPIVPKPKQSVIYGQGRFIAKSGAYSRELTELMSIFKPREPICRHKPVRLTVVFLMPPVKSLKCELHVVRPDTDNLVKAVRDALIGLSYYDDSQVCVERLIKLRYKNTGLLIKVDELADFPNLSLQVQELESCLLCPLRKSDVALLEPIRFKEARNRKSLQTPHVEGDRQKSVNLSPKTKLKTRKRTKKN